jgi:stalled ribosome alternative rescue factor ArfA
MILAANNLKSLAGAGLPQQGQGHRPVPTPGRCSAVLQVEEEQQQQEKKAKGKASGKRFEIKKWNAVAMCVLGS